MKLVKAGGYVVIGS